MFLVIMCIDMMYDSKWSALHKCMPFTDVYALLLVKLNVNNTIKYYLEIFFSVNLAKYLEFIAY